MRVIIVDDNDYIRSLLEYLLQQAHHEIVGQAATGQQALELCASAQPDLITLDMSLPDMTGFEVLPKLHANHPHLKILVITGNNSEHLRDEIFELGATALILKPFDLKSLREAINSLSQEGEDASS
ncbi:MAG: response regulator [Elusimicrobia bacterium]|nr:MAG: response regulator [Elusimicrobiota bacterium]